MLLPIAQMDPARIMPSVYTLTGLVIIPGTLLAFYLVARRKTRSALTVAFTVIASLVLVVWVAALVNLQSEPSIDDAGAWTAVQNLPEVKQFETRKDVAASMTRDARVAIGPQGSPGWEVTVGDFDQMENAKIGLACVCGQCGDRRNSGARSREKVGVPAGVAGDVASLTAVLSMLLLRARLVICVN
jgi:hypothetical protein